MKRKTIKELELEVNRLTEEISVLKNNNDEVKNRLTGILFPSNSSGFFRNDVYSLADLFREITSLKTRVRVEGELLPYVDQTIKEENTKLWYLVRVAMNDKSITEPINYSTGESKFTKTNFN